MSFWCVSSVLVRKIDPSSMKGIYMKDLFNELIRVFGRWVILALILLGVLVWIIAHLNAEPGQKVSILWLTLKQRTVRSKSVGKLRKSYHAKFRWEKPPVQYCHRFYRPTYFPNM